MLCMYTKGYYSVIKRYEVHDTWIYLENIVVSERQTQKLTSCIVPFTRSVQKRETRSRNADSYLPGAEGRNCSMNKRFSFQVMEMV